jgi:mannose-6-phosphate isomerase-like protein (cupin superfamily)
MIVKKDFFDLAAVTTQPYFNTVLNTVNDHVVRISVMTSPYPWHSHPNSDETFIGVEGVVIIETADGEVQLTPGSSVSIPRGVVHRTRPAGARSVNLTIERADMETVFAEKGKE